MLGGRESSLQRKYFALQRERGNESYRKRIFRNIGIRMESGVGCEVRENRARGDHGEDFEGVGYMVSGWDKILD